MKGSRVSNLKVDPNKEKIVDCSACKEPMVVGKFSKINQKCKKCKDIPKGKEAKIQDRSVRKIVKPIAKNELIMIVIGTSLSAGSVTKIGKHNSVTLQLKRPICALGGSIVAVSRRINNRFRLIGYGYLAE